MKMKLPRLSNLLEIPLSASEDIRRQKMLELIIDLIGSIAAILVIWAIISWQINPNRIYEDYREMVLAGSLMAVGSIIIFILNRFGTGIFARILFVALLLLFAFFDTPEQITNGRALLMFALPIMAAAILIRPWAGFVLAFISAVLVEYIAHTFSPPMEPLPGITVFFIMAILIWLATASLENQITRLRETNIALTDSEERYRTLVEISPDMVVLTDLYGRIVVVNQAGLSLFGFTHPEEVKGKRVFDFIAEDDRQRSITEFNKIAEQRSMGKVEFCAQTPQGANFYIEVDASVLRDSAGNPQAVLCIGRDITLRKRMEQAVLAEKDEAYRALVDNSTQGLVLLQNGRILLANAAIANCLGLTIEEMYALPADQIFDYVHPDDREIGYLRMQERLQGKPVPASYETRTIQKDGTIHWLELRPTIITLNGTPASQITAIDITERKNAEEAMRVAHDQLDAILNTLPDLMFELDREQRFCDFRAMKSSAFFPTHQFLRGKTVRETFPADAAQVISAALDDALVHGQHRGATYDVDMPVGNFSFELSISTLGDMEQPMGRFIVLVRDITERKLAEKALSISEKKYRTLHESMRDGFVFVSMDGRILDCNEAYRQMIGYNAEELSRCTYVDVTPEKWHSFEQKIVDEQILPKGYSDIYEKEYQNKNGTVFPVELRTFLVRDETGSNQGMWAIVRDITERKRAEEALKEREKRYRDLFENASLAVFQSEAGGKIIDVNSEFARIFGYESPEEFKTLVTDAAFVFANPERRAEIIRLRAEDPTRKTFENIYRRKDGSTFIGQLTVKSIMDDAGHLQCFEGFIEDITSRKETERALRQSEERYRSLAETAQDIIVILNAEDQIEYINQFAARTFGMAPEKVIGRPRSQFFPPAINDRHVENIQKIITSGQPLFTESHTPIPGGEIWLSNWMVPLKDEKGITKEVLTISRDISEHKRIEAALRESEERYRNLAEAAQDMIFIINPNDRIEYINQFAARMVGAKNPEETLGQPRSRYFPTNVNERQHGYIQNIIEKGTPIYSENPVPFLSGEKWLSTWLVPLKDDSGKTKAILGISRDISERKALEKSLIDAKNLLEERVAERTADLNTSREKLRQLTHETVMTQENERRRLSRELHDETGQALIGLTFSLDEILAETPEELEKIHKKITKTLAKVDELSQQIRRMAHGLRPTILDVAGIDLALNSFCREFSEETHIPIIYNGAKNLPVLPEETSITLYRIVQESITNAVKHGHASEAHVSLGYDGKHITLVIRDNGIGFETANTPKGVGLLGMEERLGLLHGKLEIASRRKHGTRLKAVVPVM